MTRGIDIYTQNLLRRWSRDHRVELSLIKTRTGDPPPVDIDAPFVGLSFARTMVQRFPPLAKPLDQVGKDHDVVFLPNMAVYPTRGRAPVVVMAHDATSILHPEYFTARERLWHRQVNLRSLLRRADRVLANSHQTRQELQAFGVRPEQIRVIHLGIEEQYRPAPEAQVRAIREKHRIPDGPYFLYLGAVERRKNVAALVSGFTIARQRGLDATLVIAGAVRDHDQLQGADGGVHVIGWIDAEDKPALYTGASANVSLATHEGFGFVPLEALACGAHSILSPLAVYAETIKDRATYLRDFEPATLSDALIAHRRDPPRLNAAEVKEVLTEFSWDTCASESLREILAAARKGVNGT